MLLRSFSVVLLLAFVVSLASAQSRPDSTSKSATPNLVIPTKWYDKIRFRGYAQIRYNRLLETNPDLKCEQCDRSIGGGESFFMRRGRVVFSGDVHPRLFVLLQFDYASDASSNGKHFLQVRDAYFDIALDKKKEFRVRVGQSKVPYGFENMQSSSNRIPLDRADALNSGAPNERDLGAFFYYAPAKTRAFFSSVANAGLKGSGDYGVFGFGIYNGQTTNRPEQNDGLHIVTRLSYPFQIGKQVLEPGIQAYSGKYTLSSAQLSSGVKIADGATYTDRRVAATLMLYQKPFGLLAEYNIGQSPTFDANTDSIQVQNLSGGYITASYRGKCGKGLINPYTRIQMYEGGKKHELDARKYAVNEIEMGLEWLPFSNIELTVAYVISHRKYDDFKTAYDERGNFMRLQLQINY